MNQGKQSWCGIVNNKVTTDLQYSPERYLEVEFLANAQLRLMEAENRSSLPLPGRVSARFKKLVDNKLNVPRCNADLVLSSAKHLVEGLAYSATLDSTKIHCSKL